MARRAVAPLRRRARRFGLRGLVLAVAAVSLLAGAASAEGGFDDDDENVHEPAIDAVAAEGILDGTECGEGLICPGEPFERWVMAVWLIRALGEAPSTASTRFADVNREVWWAPYVERLAELDITLGCATGPARYCPDDPVSRGQMATFLVRAFGLEPGPAAGFGDTIGHAHASNIDGLAAAGITAGCATDPPRYCPGEPVTRGQMATFLARALELVPLPEPPGSGVGVATHSPFTAVATHELFSCGLRADGTVDCWGWLYQGSPVALDGRFREISLDFLPCGLRIDGTVGCWSPDSGEGDDPPEGKFSSIDGGGLGSGFLCGLRTDETIECWGRDSYGATRAPEGRFGSVTVGEDHACGLGVDGTVSCWGSNNDGQADPPSGLFTAVSAGSWYTCGLRLDGTVACWGSLPTGPPEGRFDALVAGDHQACATRADRTIACWGHTHDAPPDGKFTAVSIAYPQSCGIRTDGTLACWGDREGNWVDPGDREEGWVDPPEGRFTAVDTGIRSCGVRDDGTIECWGFNPWWPWRALPPEGQFTAVDTGGLGYSCALGVDGVIGCWGGLFTGRGLFPPASRYTAVATERAHTTYPDSISDYPTSCAIRADDRTVDCWGTYLAGSPGGQFSAIDGGLYGRYCGIRTDGTLACWRRNRTDLTDVPEGRFRAVAVGVTMSCAIRVDGTVGCWGEDAESGVTEVPTGRFAAISSFDSGRSPHGSGIASRRSTVCGLRTDGSVTCWGANHHALSDVPDGRFVAVTTGQAHACALKPDGTAVCWGSDEHGRSTPPYGPFTALTAGDSNTCGLRTDGTVDCWGEKLAIPPPAGVKELGPDPFELDRPPKTTTRHIAYVTALPDDPAVFVADADGGNEERLTGHEEISGDPAWSPDGKRIAFTRESEDGIFVIELDGGAPRRLTRFGGSGPAWSPDGERIVFTRYFDSSRQIFTIGADGSGQRQLTREGGADPVWSPAGDRIAFTRRGELYVMNADGSGQTRLSGQGGEDPSWSADGSRIAFTRNTGSSRQIFTVGADGTGERQLTREGGRHPAWSPDGSDIAHTVDGNLFVIGADGASRRQLTRSGGREPLWSPDGSRIAFISDRDIHVIDADGSNRRQITEGGGWSPSWSPDGSRITYSRHIRTDVIVMDRDGTDKRVVARNGSAPSWSPDGARLTYSGGGNVHAVDAHGGDPHQVTRDGGWNPAWSPDGRLIAFTRDAQIFTVRPDGGGERQVTRDAAVTGVPVWSPDSRLIAYSEGGDLFVIGADGTGVRRLTYGGGRNPSWSPDSFRIAFTTRVGDLDEVSVIDADGTDRRQLTNGGGWDPAWSPDGSRIAFSSRAEVDHSGGIESINLVSIVDYIGLVNAEGDPVLQVVTRSGSARRPVWSPDGTLIIYTSGASGWLGSIRPDGSDRTSLITEGGYSPVWSPAGR